MINESQKRLASRVLAILATSVIGTAAATANPFFAFDNGLGKKSPAEQAALMKQLGYDGIGYTGTGDFAARKKAFDEQGLKIYNLYVPAFLKSLDAVGYKGPVGLQCYQVPGAPEEHLKRSITRWMKMIHP